MSKLNDGNQILTFLKKRQMSEAVITSAFLALSGGFQDAYTYIDRGQVFANAQTGNIVLMAGDFFQHRFAMGLRYLIPLVAFIIGIYVAEHIHRHHKYMKSFHWRQAIVLIEIVILFLVAFVPQSMNKLANAMVSFVCAMQVQSFRKINGYAYASTMCIGNIRSCTESLYFFVHSKNKSDLKKTVHYVIIILCFGIGAGFGSIITNEIFEKAIWISCIFLTICFIIMFISPFEEDITD